MDIKPIYIGIAAGVFTAIAMLPQLIKIIRTRHAEQLSLAMILILLAGLGLWIWYGTVQQDYPVVITNAFSALINILIVIFSLKYKK
ncbi:MAG: SemiSWEET family sugar transporter [Agriterribacter sp.]